MTDELESKAQEWIEGVDDLGGAVSAIEAGYVQNAIAENAYRRELAVDAGEIKVVGVNAFVDEHDPAVEILSIDQHKVDRQIERVKTYKAAQDRAKVDDALARLRETAAGETNLLPVIKSAFEAGATLGQAGNALRDVFGEYRARS
jgi:methylmalonyl-CoA mutase N-terminal domain/subunit